MKKQNSKRPVSEKPAYHHGDLRRSLLDATLGLVKSHGVQGFTLREAARAANVSHNAPYRHFPSRTHLLIELAIEGQSQLLEAMKSAVDQAPDHRERLIRLGLAYMDFAIKQEAHFHVMFSSEVATEPTPVLLAAKDATYQFFEAELSAATKAGLIRKGHVEQFALVGWSAIHGAAMLVVDGVLKNTSIGSKHNPDEIARLAIETVLTGILARP